MWWQIMFVPDARRKPPDGESLMVWIPLRQIKIVYVKDENHSCQWCWLLTVNKSTMNYTEREKDEFVSFQRSSILPLLSSESTMSIMSPLPFTPKRSTSLSKNIRQKNRNYTLSLPLTNPYLKIHFQMRKIPSKLSLSLTLTWFPNIKEVPVSIFYKPSATYL